MPVESELDRRLRGTEAGGGGKVNPTASGKKRKKKKKEKSETGGAKIAAREEAREAGQVLKRKDSERKVAAEDSRKDSLTGSSVLLKGSDRCSSSSSSIENSKPIAKLGRFDYSSSDAMSTGGQTSASSSAAMEASNSGVGGGVPSNNPLQAPTDLSVTLPVGASLHGGVPQHKPASTSSATQQKRPPCTSERTGVGSFSVDQALESLRWEQECSDEEKERQRIEVYKENRRKRYENALAEKKAQLSLHTSNRVKYYW